MAIVKMNKFSLFLFRDRKEELLQSLQEFEGVQFINLQNEIDNDELSFLQADSESKKASEFETELSKVKFCINILDDYIEKESAIEALKKGKKALTFKELQYKAKRTNWTEVYDELKNKDNMLTTLKNEKTKLESEIQSLTPWSSFDSSFEELDRMKLCKGYIGTIPTSRVDSLREELSSGVPYSYLEVISEEKNDSNILIVYYAKMHEQAEEIIKSNGFSKVDFNYKGRPNEIIERLTERIKQNEKEQKEVVESIKEYKNRLEDLQLVYEYFNNQVIKAKACENFLKSEKIIVLQGWVSAENSVLLEESVEKVCGEYYYIDFKDAEDEENVPIELRGNAFTEPFHGITEMYSLPSYREVDPTPVLSIFYVLFFGMMLSDAGYGLVLTVGTLIALKVFKLDKAKRNFLKLFCYLGLSTVFWGFIYGGFFGDALGSGFGLNIKYFNNPLIDPKNDLMTVLGMSVVFGLIHIYIGLGMKAYVLAKNKKYMDIVYDVVTWYVAVTGLILLVGKSMLPGVPPILGKVLTIAGLIGLLLTQGREADSIGGKIGGGVYGLYGITSYVGDLVSYSRLLALGLATGFIATAFNLMVNLATKGMIKSGNPILFIIGLILAVVMFTFLHVFNIGINALGAYVHTSRLQYLEFFGKFYEGGGKKFSPFKPDEKFINIKNER
ncbi:V-type ATP synthase subunit I [Clostridium tepidiprofundi DSM 19306]|uniref:V-type ATP synthase subunit I n=1 Tax=Clostridium tepidiprofundi DSM 19306 TaxID=1121338 RepID=A0A151B533_9CLOT|nr:V-type ATP synthase subunit I [Clostridium tepidiprofundi]KYH35018.1 V-type ATP synthase subunit I [Clostridium tepidiprofundi DSM 19306]